MGINMGFHVKHVVGSNAPIPIAEPVEEEFFAFLRERHPQSEDAPVQFGGGWVSCHRKPDPNNTWQAIDEWDFDVRPYNWEPEFVYQLYESILAFIVRHLGIPFDEYLELEMYWC